MANLKSGKGKNSRPVGNQLDDLVNKISTKYGRHAGSKGSLQRPLKSIPTGILALDFALGTGGWARGYLHGVYGPRDVGKSTIVGLSAIREGQQMGLTAAIVAVEPGFDPIWAEKHGVNTSELLIARPETGEEAFAMAHEIVSSKVVDIVIFDSIGALLSESEIDEDGKMKMGGQAGLITWGVKRLAPIAYKNETTVILLNQIRDVMSPNAHGGKQQPGGNALEHTEATITRLRPGSYKNRYTMKIAGDDVLIGRELIAIVERNKLSEGTNRKAVFDFYQMEVDGYPFGIDHTSDIINTAMRTGVISQRGSMYDLPDGKTLKGRVAVGDYFASNPSSVGTVRDGVLKAMVEQNTKTTLEVVSD